MTLGNAVMATARLEHRTGTTEAHEWYRQLLADPRESHSVKQAVSSALRLAGDPSFLPVLANELRACPVDDAAYAQSLSLTISVLLGRRLHGEGFGETVQ